MNFPEHIRDFDAKNIAFWLVDGSDLRLETDADVPMEKLRRNLQQDIAAQNEFRLSLPYIHWKMSFDGIEGSSVMGRGWRLHKPRAAKKMDLWESVSYTSLADWTEVAPPEVVVLK